MLLGFLSYQLETVFSPGIPVSLVRAVACLVRQNTWPGCGARSTGIHLHFIQRFSVILHHDVNTFITLLKLLHIAGF